MTLAFPVQGSALTLLWGFATNFHCPKDWNWTGRSGATLQTKWTHKGIEEWLRNRTYKASRVAPYLRGTHYYQNWQTAIRFMAWKGSRKRAIISYFSRLEVEVDAAPALREITDSASMSYFPGVASFIPSGSGPSGPDAEFQRFGWVRINSSHLNA